MTLDDGTTTVILPDALEWVNEFDWSSVEQEIERTIGGTLVVSEKQLTKGMPISLVGGDNVWVERSVVKALMAWVNTPDKTLTLTLPDARTFSVIFDRTSQPLEAKPVWRKNIQAATDKYTLALNLMEV